MTIDTASPRADFLKFWLGQTLSALGDQFTQKVKSILENWSEEVL